MSAWITTTLALAITAVLTGSTATAGCSPRGSGRCIDTGSAVDLNSVSEIASKIVNEEPIGQKQERQVTEPVAPTPYTGPIFGAAPGKRTPTVGYSWSLQ
jgi:hypothetical protein